MRRLLRLYVFGLAMAAVGLLSRDLSALDGWPRGGTLGLMVALVILSVAAEHLQFQVQRGWQTHAGTVPHIATVFLLPPGLAVLVAALAMAIFQASQRRSRSKLIFNTASIALAVSAAAHLTTALGGARLVQVVGSTEAGWLGPLVACVAAATYYVVSAITVAGAVALDQRRPFWGVVRGKIGFKALTEVGLGLLGAALAVLFVGAPGWTPALLLPAFLVYLAKRSSDRADRRSRDLGLTSAIGRAVAGTLHPAEAFAAITARGVRDRLRLEGMAVMPAPSDPPAFCPHVATDGADRHRDLCLELAARATAESRKIVLSRRNSGGSVAAAVPFGTREGARPGGALVAWRGFGDADFNDEEVLVLETLADYASVALETARLADETARLSREAGEAQAMREVEAMRDLTRLKDEWLGQVSHELRTPLTVIHSFAEMLSDGFVAGDAIPEMSAEIHRSSSLMLRLVDDLLDTSRLESGRLDLKLETMDLGAWLGANAQVFGQACPGHRIAVRVPATLPRVRADQARLGQVLNNLLTNATRYSPEGTTITVSARSLADAEEVEFRVTDQGVGIPREERDRIFEKFYRSKSGVTHAVRGTGLGLAVARSLVEAHRGQIGLESVVSRGSTFWVRLPALPQTTEMELLPQHSPLEVAA